MKLTLSMEMALVLFLLCSGFPDFTFAVNRLRVFRLGTDIGTWSVSLKDCHDMSESFVTLYDQEDANFTRSFLNGTTAWLGLHYGRNSTWSNGVPANLSVAYREQRCRAIDNGTQTNLDCSEKMYFMCSKDSKYTLIQVNTTWCQALQYCRAHVSDLVSIDGPDQELKVIEAGKNTSFWIGLMLDKWEWEDNGCSSFRVSSTAGKSGEECTQYNSQVNQLLYENSCGNEEHPFCSKGTVRIRVIEHRLTWEEAFNYCKKNHSGLLWIEDESDQAAVKQWLAHTSVTGPFWIGLRQSRVFGFWIWSDRMVDYSYWKDDKPPAPPLSHLCGVINETDYRWSDADCLVKRPFLCEEEIIFMTT